MTMPNLVGNAGKMKSTGRLTMQSGSNFMTDEFLSVLSHELRTPLTPILGWVSLLRQSGSQDPQVFDRALTAIERNAEHQKALVNDLMDVSLILSGRIQLDCHRRSLGALLRGIKQALEPVAQERSVTIELDLPDDLPSVNVDGPRIHQAILNIVSNAIKFSNEGDRITIKATRQDHLNEKMTGPVCNEPAPESEETTGDNTTDNGYICLEITDRGEGIAEDLLPRIFDMFQQGDGSSTRRHGGLGLGLSISRGFIEMHGGSVCVASEGLGKGATFTITLPAAE